MVAQDGLNPKYNPDAAGISITAFSQIWTFSGGKIIKMRISLIELENVLWYTQDKNGLNLQVGTEKAIQRFLEDNYGEGERYHEPFQIGLYNSNVASYTMSEMS
ncbi:hypothetical protein [Lentibacillus cibarius]|uniref:Uncharacterized protein n=1 Tax=Lentibacillus cibarius TaxID=2583219 RepID=A0A5S3R6P0_9BACI|nr:hypothetical protein [Lentibacillus cibarius]TMN20863.1 hypothetical protein FFL34_01095 [Lentibacillus cibarius]